MPEPVNQDVEWYDILGKFKRKAREFQEQYSMLLGTGDIAMKDPALKKEYDRLVKYGAEVRKRITQVTNAVDIGYEWLKNTLGLDGIMNADGNLSAVPAIPIAVALASIAAISKFTTDFYKYMDKVDQFKQLEKRYGADQATKIINRLDPQDSFLSMPKWMMAAIVLGGGYYLWNQVNDNG